MVYLSAHINNCVRSKGSSVEKRGEIQWFIRIFASFFCGKAGRVFGGLFNYSFNKESGIAEKIGHLVDSEIIFPPSVGITLWYR